MSLKCGIELESPIPYYYSGQLVRGFVSLTLEEQEKFSDLTFQVKGETCCRWTEKESLGKKDEKIVEYVGQEEYFKTMQTLFTPEYQRQDAPSSVSEAAQVSESALSTPSSETTAPKQLPSSKWRRERRSTTRIPDYKHREPGAAGNKASRSQSFNDKSSAVPLGVTLRAETLHHSEGDLAQDARTDETRTTISNTKSTKSLTPSPEIPLDMSVKPLRASPPSYSQSITNGYLYRPSVITQAPTVPVSPTPVVTPPPKVEYTSGSMSMCDPVIDEHFRRSLGADYMNLFNKTKETNGVTNGKTSKGNMTDRASSPITFASDPCTLFLIPSGGGKSPNETESNTSLSSAENDENSMEVDEDAAGLSVDDHFAKALGDTWKKLQEKTTPSDKLKSNNSNEVTKNGPLSVKSELSNANRDSGVVSRSIAI